MIVETRIQAEAITPERCCFITGVLRACDLLHVAPMEAAMILSKLGVTLEEVHHECVGKSDGKVR